MATPPKPPPPPPSRRPGPPPPPSARRPAPSPVSAARRPGPPPPPAVLPYASGSMPLYESGQAKARTAQIFLGVWMALSVLCAISTTMQAQLLKDRWATWEQAIDNDLRQTVLTLLQVAGAALAVTFLMLWVHRANRNLRALGARNMAFTPGWAVGYWFIPILNFFRPCQIMYELWRESRPAAGNMPPGDRERGMLLIGAWWGTYILWVVLFQVGAIMLQMNARRGGYQEMLTASWIQVGAYVSLLIASALLITLVMKIEAGIQAKAPQTA